jgi:hypothetical protein
MKQIFIIAVFVLLNSIACAQKSNYTSIAVFTTQTAMPFSKFSGLFKEVFHPGVEVGYGKIFNSGTKHYWFAEIKLAYFYHRFVQHGLPFYINTGYSHKIYKKFSAETSIGAGYMHSIPATAKFKLNNNGEYVNNKGLGRMQAMATVALGLSFHPGKALGVFINYQQRLQFPFVKSYVPLLPYNSILIGINKSIHRNHKA